MLQNSKVSKNTINNLNNLLSYKNNLIPGAKSLILLKFVKIYYKNAGILIDDGFIYTFVNNVKV